jgi:cyclopropane-fatty-acyl-phospholipid synthase
MWDFYLLASAGSFRSRKLQLWQFVMARDGVPFGYHAGNIR